MSGGNKSRRASDVLGQSSYPMDPEGHARGRVHLTRPDDAAWEACLAGVRHDVFHTPAYHSYSEAMNEGSPYLVTVSDGARGVAWPYLLRPIAQVPGLAGSGATDVTSVYGYPGPLTWGCCPGDPFITRAWSRILDVWHQQGAVAAFTRFHPLLDNAQIAPSLSWPRDRRSGPGGVARAGTTVSIDLTLDMVAIRAGYGRDVRRRIDVARRDGLTTSHDEDWDQLPIFSRLYLGTMERAGANQFYFFGEDDFVRLRASLGGILHLLVTKRRGRVVAAGLFTEFDGIVEWLLAGSDPDLAAPSGSKVLVDDAIQWARDRGNKVMHIGGGRGGREDPLFWFKSRFSPRRHTYHVGSWVLDREAYDELVTARAAHLAKASFVDRGYFPAYRVGSLKRVRPGSMSVRHASRALGAKQR